jgi:hypothetical protein
MENERTSSTGAREEPARLIHDIPTRVLNCSAGGCLLETTTAVAVNTVAALHVSFDGRQFEDLVQVVRCQASDVTNDFYLVATRFLALTAPDAGSLRYVLQKETSGLVGWLDHSSND